MNEPTEPTIHTDVQQLNLKTRVLPELDKSSTPLGANALVFFFLGCFPLSLHTALIRYTLIISRLEILVTATVKAQGRRFNWVVTCEFVIHMNHIEGRIIITV